VALPLVGQNDIPASRSIGIESAARMPWNPVMARAMPAQYPLFLSFDARPLSWAMTMPIFQSCLVNIDSFPVQRVHQPCFAAAASRLARHPGFYENEERTLPRAFIEKPECNGRLEKLKLRPVKKNRRVRDLSLRAGDLRKCRPDRVGFTWQTATPYWQTP
jgi:hypothetical protein